MLRKKQQADNTSKVNEPQSAYASEGARTIRFFSSFEEAEEYKCKMMAEMTPTERLENLEILRKRFLSEYLDANGNWPPLKHIVTIVYGERKNEFPS